MKAGNFNIHDYLNKLQESATEGGLPNGQQDGLIIPEENKKAYSWLKKAYDRSKVEVKVEIKMGGSKFSPGYDLQTDLKSVKDFKPGMYGDIKTSDTPGSKTDKKDYASSQGENEGKKPKNEKTAEKSTGSQGATGPVLSAKVKTAEDEDEDENNKKDKEK